MPDTARADFRFSRADRGARVTTRFRHRVIRFRHFIDGSLAIASLNLDCRDHFPAFPRRCRVGPGILTRPTEEMSGRTIFYRDETGAIFHTYSSFARSGEVMLG